MMPFHTLRSYPPPSQIPGAWVRFGTKPSPKPQTVPPETKRCETCDTCQPKPPGTFSRIGQILGQVMNAIAHPLQTAGELNRNHNPLWYAGKLKGIRQKAASDSRIIRLSAVDEVLGLPVRTPERLETRNALLKALAQDEHPLVRGHVAVRLRMLGETAMAQALLKDLLADTDPKVRWEAVVTLPYLKDQAVVRDGLAMAVKDSDPEVRGAVTVAIARQALSNPKAFQAWDPKTITGLLMPLCGDEKMSVRKDVAGKLPVFPVPDSDKIAMMSTLWDMSTPAVKSLIIEATAKLPLETGAPVMRRYLLDLNPENRRQATTYVMQIPGNAPVKKALMDLVVSDPDERVRTLAGKQV